MKTLLACLLIPSFLLLARLPALSQRSTPTEVRINNMYSGEAIDAYDLRPRSMEGSLYFREEKGDAAIQLKNGRVMNGVPALYNLESNNLEIFTENGVFEVPGGAIREFTIEAASGENEAPRLYRFVNLDQFASEEPVKDVVFGYYLLEGSPSLLAGYEVDILKPNYVPALDAGSLNPKAVQKERFFLLHDERLGPIPTRRKKAAEMLEPFRPGVNAYLKKEGVDLKEPDDLIRLVQWLNGA